MTSNAELLLPLEKSSQNWSLCCPNQFYIPQETAVRYRGRLAFSKRTEGLHLSNLRNRLWIPLINIKYGGYTAHPLGLCEYIQGYKKRAYHLKDWPYDIELWTEKWQFILGFSMADGMNGHERNGTCFPMVTNESITCVTVNAGEYNRHDYFFYWLDTTPIDLVWILIGENGAIVSLIFTTRSGCYWFLFPQTVEWRIRDATDPGFVVSKFNNRIGKFNKTKQQRNWIN